MLAAAIAIALSYWGGPPPCTPVVHVHELDRGSGVLGIAHPSTGYCEVEIASRRWRWGELCSVLVHEFGHLHGLGHSPDPLNVMFPELLRTADACRGKRPARFRAGDVIRL